jgi:hypothetical protein
MSRTDYNVAGLHQSHDPLSTNGRARLMRLAAWHLSQAPDNWPLETSAPWIEIDENRKFVFAFRSVRDHDADSAIGAELGLAHLKARRPCGPGIDADPDPGACSLWAFAEAFSGTTHTVGLRLGFFGALDTLLDAALVAPKAHARALLRLDALDHAECAARLEAITDGYTPPDLVIADCFGLLTRAGVVL